MWYRIKQYLIYLFRSKSIYKIHSPFVYNLVAHVLESKDVHADLQDIQKLRQDLQQDNRAIVFEGYGARQEKKSYSIKHIEKYISLPHSKGKWYYQMIQHYAYKNMLELGTCIGIGSLYLAKNKEAKVYSFEANNSCIAEAKKHFSRMQLSNIDIVEGDIDISLPQFAKNCPAIDMLVMDANHTYEETIAYYNTLQPLMSSHSVIIIDDIYWSKEMTRAWNDIRNRPEVTLSLDFYRCGFIYFDHNRVEKEHFKVWVND